MKIILQISIGLSAVLASGLSGFHLANRSHADSAEIVRAKTSRVMRWDEARVHEGEWGQFRIYFTGDTYSTTNAFTGICVVKPGKAVHPNHRHAEEEYLVITEGEGMWHLDGREIPARKGDVLYVEPWVFHGLLNTGEQDLTFFVVKYASKGWPNPPAPAGSHGQ
jgi:mannose-6-phosphate isomerase-like protein (cupin superfamily)